jgi:hypothetical protein
MDTCPLTGRLIAAARALVGVSSMDLAKASGVEAAKLMALEALGAALVPEETDAHAIRRALETFGAVFVAEGTRFGAGVRLKFRRDDTRQILRLEGEGGLVRNDEVP